MKRVEKAVIHIEGASVAEVKAKILDEGLDPDCLLWKQGFVSTQLSSPFGFTETGPIRGLVAGSTEAGDFDKSLH